MTDHRYLSTGCLHGEHAYCQGKTGRVGAKKPAACKFCDAPCTCPCHQANTPADTANPAAEQPEVAALHLTYRLPRGV